MKWFAAAFAAVGLSLAAAGSAAAQAAVINIPAPSPPVGALYCQGGFVYQIVTIFPGGVGQANLGGSQCVGTGTTFSLVGGGGSFHAYQGLYGGPNSAQFLALRDSLDLESIQAEGEARFDFDDEGDADTIGYAGTYFDAPGVDGWKHELRYAKNFRPFEGQRTRAHVNTAAQVVAVEDETNFNGLIAGGLEFPVQPNWSLTPRLAVSASSGSDFFGGDGYVGTVSVASRYRFPQVGRGDLVLGNMLAYTAESEDDTQNVVLRNGIAYQYPLQQRVFGRQSTFRASYVNTQIEGDPVGIDSYHELSVNLGVRMREADVRNKFELLRFGFIYTAADGDYQAGTFTVGYRF